MAAKKEKPTAPKAKFKYECPFCGDTAVESSNKMIGPTIPCASCKASVVLDDESKYERI